MFQFGIVTDARWNKSANVYFRGLTKPTLIAVSARR